MRFTQTSLITAIGFGTVWIAAMASCSEDDPDNLLTTASTSMQVTTGMGGSASDGGGGSGADGGSEAGSGGNVGGNGGNGGQGGEPEELINGCRSSFASDLTGMGTSVTVTYPPAASPVCLIVAEGTSVTFDIGATDEYRLVYGLSDGLVQSPLVPSGCMENGQPNCPAWVYCQGFCTPEPHYCPASPYDCGVPPAFGPLNKAAAYKQVNGHGAFPFYDDTQPTGDLQGVIYVQ